MLVLVCVRYSAKIYELVVAREKNFSIEERVDKAIGYLGNGKLLQ